MPLPLLTTKLYVPTSRADLVQRPHLIERLSGGLEQHGGFARKLTLVSAPAGYGKTTLVTEWLSSGEHPFTWLSLDGNDADPAQFLTYLVAALRGIDPAIGHAAQAMLRAPQLPPLQALLTSLVNDIATTPQPFVLVLDDYHLVHATPIHQHLTFLLEHGPPRMHLVIVTREDPLLPLSRWRARGQMMEIRQADLRFTEGEAADLLQRMMRLELSSADVAALHQRTEGWVAGLQLAAISLRGRDDVQQLVQSFAGSHHYILDYLIEEVFQRQPADVQDFLLMTSVLDRFTAPLCNALTGRDDSHDVLLALEHSNLFTVPLDESRQWYRYHHLFADLLRQRLRRVRAPDLVARLHMEASLWYESGGLTGDAVHHALAAPDWERAATLIRNVGETMLKSGRVSPLLAWLQALPDEEIRARPQLCLTYGWALALTGRMDAAESCLEHAEQAAQDAPALLGEIIAVQAYIARGRGDDHRTIELSQRALSLLPQADAASRSVVALSLGVAHWTSGHLAAAEQALAEADHAAQQSGNAYARLTALGFLGTIQAARGKLHRAAELLGQAVRSGGGSPAVAYAHVIYGALLLEWNDLEAAADHVQRGIALGQHGGNVEIQISAYRTLAQLKQAQGDASAALNALQQAHQLASERGVPPLMRARNAARHVQLALAQDDLAAATHWAEQATDGADACPFYPLLGLVPARLLLAQNRKAAAAEQLAVQYEAAVHAGWQFGVLEVRALQALAAPTPAAALTFLADALRLAQPERHIRAFVDKGEPMAALLHEAASKGIARDYVAQLLAAFGAARQERGCPEPPVQPLIEPLSERELQVLRLVAAGLSNPEVADTLYISVNTVKTHLQRIYGKLGTSSRTAAATKAQELDLF